MKFTFDDKIRFLQKAFGHVEKCHDGKNVAVSCPQCKNPNKKKLAIRLDDDRVNCWVCHLKGRVVYVLKKYKPYLVAEYIEKFGVNNIILHDEGEKRAEIPEGFRLIAAYPKDPRLSWARKYCRKRGLTERDLWYFKIGVSTEKRFYRRVIMLSFDASGNLNYYSGRAVDNTAYRKYWNADVPKKSIIFNEINIDWKKELTLVEGPFDLTKADVNTVPVLGSELSEDSLLFARIYENKTPINLAFDKDMEQKEWQKIARMLDSYGISVKIMNLGQYNDVGEMSRIEFLAAKSASRPWDRREALLRKIKGIGTGSLFSDILYDKL